MDENIEELRRKPGRPKKKRSTGVWDARRICDNAGCNPIEVALYVIKHGKFPAAPGRVSNPVSESIRAKLLEQVIGYVAPRLSSNTTVAAVQVEQTSTSFDVTELMRDPKLAEAAQTLALALTESKAGEPTHSRLAIDGPQREDD